MKTKTTRFIGMLLFAVMLLTSVPIAVQAEEYPSIALDEEKLVELDGSAVTEVIFSFTPAETDLYMFRSYDSDYDTYGYILDAEENVINENDDYLAQRDFHTAAILTAGTTYLLKARFFTTANAGSMKITVEKAVKATSIIIDVEYEYEDILGALHSFYYDIFPEGAYAGDITWTTSDPAVAEIYSEGTSYGEVLFKSVGTTTLTATPEYGTADTATLTVADVGDIALDAPTKADVSAYSSASFRFTPEEDGTYVFYTVDSTSYTTLCSIYGEDMEYITNETVYEYEDLYVTFSAEAGKTYVINVWHTGSDNLLDVYVSKSVPATGIALDKTSYDDTVGKSFTLKAYFVPGGAIPENITWSSSDNTVASVDENGQVSLLKEGTATITVTSENGLTASCAVTVNAIPTISRCEMFTVTLGAGETEIYSFTPQVDGTYAFISFSEEQDTYGCILSEDMTELASDDDGAGNGRNFKVQYEMTAGTVYLLKAEFYYEHEEGSFAVTAVMIDSEGNPIHRISEWTHDEETHSGICAIGNETVTENHSFDADGNCMCGYFHIHECEYWYKDATDHWGTCTGCEQYVDEAHVYNSEDVCAVCGYYPHDCIVSSWGRNDQWHWGSCDLLDCDVEERHSFDADGNCVCGYFEHTCNLEELEYGQTEHWWTCTLCDVSYYFFHNFDTDGNCVCGYFTHEHDLGETAYNSVEHYTVCTLCHLQITDGELHSYDEDGACSCGRERFDGVCIGAASIMDGEYLNLEGEIVTEEPDMGYAYLKDGILTLHNFVYVGDEANPFGEPCGIYAETPLTLLLEGTNKIHCQDGDGILVNGLLVIEGDGSIEVIADGDYDGIDADGGGLTVNSGIIQIDATDHGIETVGDLIINGGVFAIEADDDGMDINGDITINNGLFKIYAQDNGIDGYQDITINGGDFYIVTNDDNGFDLDDGDITINGGYFEILTEDEGISCYGKVTINGGSFVFDAGDTDAAIEAYTVIFVDASFGEYLVDVDDYGAHLLTDLDGNILQDFILKPEDLEGVDQLREAWVSFSEEGVLSYGNGGFTLPELSVTNGEGDTLTEGEDYTVSLIPDFFVNGGTYAVVVEGKGDYNGYVFELYTLLPGEDINPDDGSSEDEPSEDEPSEDEPSEEPSQDESSESEPSEDVSSEDSSDNVSSEDVADVVYGDVNGDGTVNSLDAAQVLKHDALLITLEGGALIAGDVNVDEAINSLDAAQVLKFDALLIDSFPAEQAE